MATQNKTDVVGIAEIAIIGGAVYLVYKVVSPLLSAAGLNSEAEEQINDVVSMPADQNPFSISYEYGLYGQAPGAYGASFWQNLKNVVFSTPGIDQTQGLNAIAAAGETLEGAFGTFYESDTDVFNAFANIGTKADVSNLASYLYFNFGDDLFNMLNHGKGFIPFLTRGMSATNLSTLINKINNLPEN